MTLRIKPSGPDFAGQVAIVITRLYQQAAGEALLNRVRGTATHVTIYQPPPMDLPNAWAAPDPGAGTGACAIFFDPVHWPHAADTQSRRPEAVLFALLQAAFAWQTEGIAFAAPASAGRVAELNTYLAQMPPADPERF